MRLIRFMPLQEVCTIDWIGIQKLDLNTVSFLAPFQIKEFVNVIVCQGSVMLT